MTDAADLLIQRTERLIDELRRQQGTYRPRKPVALTAADAYAAAVTR